MDEKIQVGSINRFVAVDAPDDRDRGPLRSRLAAVLLGLQCKTTVLIVALMVLVALTSTGLAVRQAWFLARRLDRERVQHDAMMVAKFAAAAVANGAPADLQPVIDGFVARDSLCFVYITDVVGNVLVAVDRTDDRVGAAMVDTKAPASIIGSPVEDVFSDDRTRYFRVSYPIDQAVADSSDLSGRTELLGYVHVGLNRAATVADFDASADLVVGIGVAIVLATIPLGFLLVRRTVAPLDEMSRVARMFSDGDLRARCAVRRSDEIGFLARDINSMADEVERKHEQIVTLNAGLERRVTERTAQLRELASREPLTGLYNRRHISEDLVRRFAEAKRYGTDLSLLMLDMDDFKSVNDTFGHQTGDELLVLTSRTIESQLRSADVAARFGGDEFVVLLPQTNCEHAEILADRILARFSKELAEKLPHLNASLSIGIACLSEVSADNHERLLRAADMALYEAKGLGKGRVVMGGPVPQ